VLVPATGSRVAEVSAHSILLRGRLEARKGLLVLRYGTRCLHFGRSIEDGLGVEPEIFWNGLVPLGDEVPQRCAQPLCVDVESTGLQPMSMNACLELRKIQRCSLRSRSPPWGGKN